MSFTNDDSDLPLHLMGHIFDREFWQRVWVVQEISFARTIYLMCGPTLCDWEHFIIVAFFSFTTTSLSQPSGE
jgi:hypothetical protein